jgi:hypothetical protein
MVVKFARERGVVVTDVVVLFATTNGEQSLLGQIVPCWLLAIFRKWLDLIRRNNICGATMAVGMSILYVGCS